MPSSSRSSSRSRSVSARSDSRSRSASNRRGRSESPRERRDSGDAESPHGGAGPAPRRRERSRSRTPGGRGPSRETSCSLLTRNLPYDCNPMMLREAFEKYGEIRDVYIPLDYYSRRPRGFGFVEFSDPRDADEAKAAMDGKRIGGNAIEVEIAKERRKSPKSMRRMDDDYRGRKGGYGGGGGYRDDYYRGGGGGYRERDYYGGRGGGRGGRSRSRSYDRDDRGG